jgi:Amt family ammonium transporter
VTISAGTVFVLSFACFWVIKKTVGLRVSAREEMDGLDISEHGMWGYPESFMPVPGGVYRPAEMPTVNPHHGYGDAAAQPSREGASA